MSLMRQEILNAFVADYSIESIMWHFGLEHDEVVTTLIEACMSGELATLYNEVNGL